MMALDFISILLLVQFYMFIIGSVHHALVLEWYAQQPITLFARQI